jgi:dimethylargininase
VHGLTTASLGPPDVDLALAQHHRYVVALRECGVDVTVLEAHEAYPDSVFVEDTAICTSRCAILTRIGVPSRRDEPAAIEPALRSHYDSIERLVAPGTLDGGDVMMVGMHFYVGLSARTNEAGARQLIAILERHGLSGSIVSTGDVLHLKTGVAYLENDNLLAIDAMRGRSEWCGLNIVRVPDAEAYAANSIWINNNVVMPAGFPRTQAAIEKLGYRVLPVDTSEFRKLDGGVSCLSLRF